jgi:acetyl-CoA C-acetyltransferase
VAPEIFRFLPTTRTEGACASSSVALYNALYAIESGRFRRVLVIGVEKMSLLNTKGVTHALACSSHWPTEGSKGMTFPGLFAEYAKGYKSHYRLSDEILRRMLAHVSALCYRNGLQNPLAHFGKGSPPDRYGLTTAEAILKLPDEGKGSNPMIEPPLRLHDCSLITDGAAAVIISPTADACSISRRAVEIAGIGMATERIAENVRPNMHELMAGKVSISRSFAEAGISIGNVDFAEVHDCFTINQVLSVEALGLSKEGEGGYDFIEGKYTQDDACPVNLSGGLKAKGHPVGATGISMHVLAYKQIVGEPIGVAPKKGIPEIGVVFNVGGSAVTNCTTTLRRIR